VAPVHASRARTGTETANRIRMRTSVHVINAGE
jgi:hypothetical protein